jgi:uncharacterized protein (DUF1499 family)
MRFLAAAPLVCMFTGIGLSSLGLIPPIVGFALFALSGPLSLVAAIAIYFTRVRKGRLNFRILVILAAIPFIIVILSTIPSLGYPVMNDVTTDLENPPEFVKALDAPANAGRDMSYPEEFKPLARDTYTAIEAPHFEEAPERVFIRVLEVAELQSGWKITNDDPATLTVEGEAQSYFFRFVDDFVIRVSESDDGARVDMRSKSRDGKGDLGTNGKRIQSFFDQLSVE